MAEILIYPEQLTADDIVTLSWLRYRIKKAQWNWRDRIARRRIEFYRSDGFLPTRTHLLKCQAKYRRMKGPRYRPTSMETYRYEVSVGGPRHSVVVPSELRDHENYETLLTEAVDLHDLDVHMTWRGSRSRKPHKFNSNCSAHGVATTYIHPDARDSP